MSDTSDNLPGKGLLGWLGRQIGYVRKAVKADVASDTPAPAADTPPERVIYRAGNVDEAEHPSDPNLKLRRTTIDEVIQRDRQP